MLNVELRHTPLIGTSDGIAGNGGAKGLRLFLPFYLFTFLPLNCPAIDDRLTALIMLHVEPSIA